MENLVLKRHILIMTIKYTQGGIESKIMDKRRACDALSKEDKLTSQ